MDRYYETKPLPSAFIWRRLQSLMGLWLVLFLIEHLLTNSQAALPVGDDGIGFIRAVNFLKSLPYFHAVEIGLLGIPFFIHIVWGIKYLFTSQQNAYGNSGKAPNLPHYPRNHAYTWQRITSWLLIIGIAGHVAQMRFINYPDEVKNGIDSHYMIRLNADEGIYTLADRLGVNLYDAKQVQKKKEALLNPKTQADGMAASFKGSVNSLTSYFSGKGSVKIDDDIIQKNLHVQQMQENQEWAKAFDNWPLEEKQLVAVTPDFGTAELLIVRETFKDPLMIFLYSLLVLAATYHAFNGLWTACITWGVTLTERSQRNMRKFSVFLTVLIGFLGLAAIWGTAFINLSS